MLINPASRALEYRQQRMAETHRRPQCPQGKMMVVPRLTWSPSHPTPPHPRRLAHFNILIVTTDNLKQRRHGRATQLHPEHRFSIRAPKDGAHADDVCVPLSLPRLLRAAGVFSVCVCAGRGGELPRGRAVLQGRQRGTCHVASLEREE